MEQIERIPIGAHTLELPADLSEYYLDAKGYFSAGVLVKGDERYRLNFYDRYRLNQTLDGLAPLGRAFFEENLVIVAELSRSTIISAVHELVRQRIQLTPEHTPTK
jgi:hypothetical protein